MSASVAAPTTSGPLPRRLLRVREVAHQLGLSNRKTYDLVQRGVIPSVRIDAAVRVRVEDLDQYVADLAADQQSGYLQRVG